MISPQFSARTRLALLAAAAAALFFIRYGLATPQWAEWFQARLGYWFVLSLLLVTLLFLTRVAVRRAWFTQARWKAERPALALIAVATIALHLHEPHMMRVIYDEPTHALTALNMHTDQSAVGATVSNYVGETFVLSEPYAVTRPYLFPLLVSVLDDISGYRVANVFVANALLTPLVLLMAYLLASTLAGRMAGYVAVGLLATLPLLAQNVTSGGYDVLNVALLGGLILSTFAYFQSTTDERGRLMDLSLGLALLLACTRPEAVLYVVPWAVATLVLWRRERRVELTTFAMISPLFLLPVFMSNLHMTASSVAMVADMRKGGERFFDVGNLPAHVSEAVFYFFNLDLDSTNSTLLSVFGAIGLVAVLVQVTGALRTRTANAAETLFAGFSLWTLGIYLFVLTQFWSSPVDPLASRFALPLMFLFAVAAGWFVTQLQTLVSRPRVVYACIALWGVLVALPMTSRATQTRLLVPAWADQYFLAYAATRDRHSTLFATASTAAFISNRYAACLTYRVGRFPWAYVRAIKAGLYHDVLVLQLFEGGKGGVWQPRAGHDIAPNVVLETVDERLVGPFMLARISRLMGYRKADGTLVTPASDDAEVNIKQGFTEYAAWQKYRLSLYP